MVGFAIDGNADLIDHQQTGYIAHSLDTQDLAQALRDKVLREFDSKVVARKYLELYKQVFGD